MWDTDCMGLKRDAGGMEEDKCPPGWGARDARPRGSPAMAQLPDGLRDLLTDCPCAQIKLRP